MVHVINEWKTDLISLIEADFGPTLTSYDPEHLFYNWLHYRARLIPSRSREVGWSSEVRQKRTAYPAINQIVASLEAGVDVSPWLSDRVRRLKSDPYADIMFNHWQVSHFHLGSVFDKPHRVKRRRDLLFAFISGSRAVLLDVAPHGSWSKQELLRILLRTSPSDMGPELKGESPDRAWTDEELQNFRKKRLNVTVTIDGRVFIPPGGISSGGGAIRIIHLMDMITSMMEEARERLQTNDLPPSLMLRIAGQIGVPVRLGLRHEAGVFYAYEKNRQIDVMRSPALE